MTRGLGIYDIAYFLYRSLSPADRQASEIEILHTYHQILLKHGVVRYSFDQCFHDYLLSLLFCLSAIVFTITDVAYTEDQKRFHLDFLLPRLCAAILDNNASEVFASS